MTGLVALTGATGFIGRHAARELIGRGWRVRALLRRDDPELATLGVEAVPGDLGDADAIGRLVDGADWVMHGAGAVSAPSDADFMRVNMMGTRTVAEAAASLPRPPRFLLLSSLAARHPSLSPYARSKRRAELEVEGRADALRPLVVRPPAVYGPGDRGTLPIMAQLARGLLVAPRGETHRFSLIYGPDLAVLLATLVESAPERAAAIEPDDAAPEGYGWAQLAALASARLDRPVRLVGLPRGALAAPAMLLEAFGRWTGKPPMLSRGKLAELYHESWLVDRATTQGLDWRPAIGFSEGLAQTLAWYKEAGWL
ncbi:NAD-dependent epimerase/dehydratase family protein [Geminicoccaceae bacterium 1502E]|nr:NAD-dependent epimerase/dehydratase family protein [Geminicoccaceae bacterium 1502E]